MSKVNFNQPDYSVFEYLKSGSFGEIVKSKLSKKEADELSSKLGNGYMFGRTEMVKELIKQQKEK